MATQRDLGLAYSPGVAAACEEIAANPDAAWDYTARGNMVAVITNGTAVLGLGAIGALASKPVMEGKAVLFKKFAGIDSIDIEVDERDPEKLIEVVAALEPSFGAINLEDIKAPECFEIERALRERMKIPVFHDDQHGTAIIVAAAVRNGLLLQGKRIEDVEAGHFRRRRGGAGLPRPAGGHGPAAARTSPSATSRAWSTRAAPRRWTPTRPATPAHTDARTLAEVLDGADVFLGLSAPRVLKAEWLPSWRRSPLILALANPEPEILPEAVRAARPDAIVATGRSDYPNQVNNVLCFPFIFRGALDVGATTINEAMKVAAAEAIAALARVEASEVVAAAYGGQAPVFGAGLHHPQALRSAADPGDRPRRGPRRDGQRRRPPPDRRFRRLPARAGALRLPLRQPDAAGVRGGQPAPAASPMPRARTSGCCARCRPCWTRASPSRC